MIDAPNYWLFIGPFALAAALPGPAQGALVAQVMARGGRSSLPFALGMVIGNGLWLGAALLGLAAVAIHFHTVFEVVKWLGVAYLLYLAVRLWRSDTGGAAAAPSGSRLFGGAALTLGNPKAVVFFGAVLPHAFDMTSLSPPQASAIVGMGLLIDGAIQLAYVAAAARGRSLVGRPERLKLVNRSAAGLVAGSAVLIATRT